MEIDMGVYRLCMRVHTRTHVLEPVESRPAVLALTHLLLLRRRIALVAAENAFCVADHSHDLVDVGCAHRTDFVLEVDLAELRPTAVAPVSIEVELTLTAHCGVDRSVYGQRIHEPGEGADDKHLEGGGGHQEVMYS